MNSYSNSKAIKTHMPLDFLGKLASESVGVEAG